MLEMSVNFCSIGTDASNSSDEIVGETEATAAAGVTTADGALPLNVSVRGRNSDGRTDVAKLLIPDHTP